MAVLLLRRVIRERAVTSALSRIFAECFRIGARKLSTCSIVSPHRCHHDLPSEHHHYRRKIFPKFAARDLHKMHLPSSILRWLDASTRRIVDCLLDLSRPPRDKNRQVQIGFVDGKGSEMAVKYVCLVISEQPNIRKLVAASKRSPLRRARLRLVKPIPSPSAVHGQGTLR
ncbi:hypothetical protein BJY00DRAFT_289060 [Aspergillus carlsbadensis]|nr:hypothetical protein BJY00DRAFT_289060 [Aspergillus carlsbadensis]